MLLLTYFGSRPIVLESNCDWPSIPLGFLPSFILSAFPKLYPFVSLNSVVSRIEVLSA
jgi:hypothetical protein